MNIMHNCPQVSKHLKDMHDQSLALMVDVQPLEDSLSLFWKAILSNENSRPYHIFKNYTGNLFGKGAILGCNSVYAEIENNCSCLLKVLQNHNMNSWHSRSMGKLLFVTYLTIKIYLIVSTIRCIGVHCQPHGFCLSSRFPRVIRKQTRFNPANGGRIESEFFGF